MFQVSIDFCNHLHPNLFEKLTFIYRCACQAEVAVGAAMKLHSKKCRGYLNLEVSRRMPRLESSYVSIYKLQPLYFVTGDFGDTVTVTGGNFEDLNVNTVPLVSRV